MSAKNTPPAGTKTHKPGCPCPICKRVRGRQEPTGEPKVGAVAIGRPDMPFSSPVAVPSIAEAHELVNNPKALELAQKLAKAEGELVKAAKQRDDYLNNLRDVRKGLLGLYQGYDLPWSEIAEKVGNVTRDLAEAQERITGQESRIEQLQNQLTATEGGAKTSDLAFRAAMWGAIETLTAGSCALQPTDPKWINTPPTELAGLLVEAVDYGRIGIEMTAVVEELLGIEGDPKRWEQQIEQALADRIEAAEGPLRAERDQWKAEAERWEAEAKRYQISTNNLGGMVKGQARGECHGPEADLPGGILSGLPNPFRWLSRWIGGGK